MPRPVAPIKFNLLAKTKYIRDGAETFTVPGMRFAETMQLFFSREVDAGHIVKHWLVRLTEQYQPLFELVQT